jgi:ribosomal-protein-alanine N-acetyltransferase
MHWFDGFPLIRLEGMVMGPLSEEEGKALFELYSNRKVCLFLQRDLMKDEKEALELIKKWDEDFYCQRGVRWGIYDEQEGSRILMGTVAIHYVDKRNRRAELGADLLPSYWGKGIITRLTEKLIEIAFTRLGLHRLEIRCMPENKASVRIALKSGFTYEGTLRDYVLIPGKGFTDESVYSLLAAEYDS